MFYPDNDTGVDTMPEIAAKRSDTVKWFTKGGKGIAPTVPGQDTWNIWQAELLNILNEAGIKPQKDKLDQLAQAIKIIAQVTIDNSDDGDYLTIAGNLEEIHANGEVAQAEARANIGIEGLIAYQDKVNRFQKWNYFDEGVTFNAATYLNGGVYIERGDSIWWGGVDSSLVHNSVKLSGLNVSYPGFKWEVNSRTGGGRFFFKAAPVHDTGGKDSSELDGRELNPLAVIYFDEAKKQHVYDVYHEGNLKPVTSINNAYYPDDKGNVNIRLDPVPNGDAAFSQITVQFTSQVVNQKHQFKPILMSDIFAGSKCTATSYVRGKDHMDHYVTDTLNSKCLPGIWRVCMDAEADESLSFAYLDTMGQRIPIRGGMRDITNINTPAPGYKGNQLDGWTYEYINVRCDVAGVGTDLLFTARVDDPEEYGRQIFANAQAGMYGELPPPFREV
ncbi:TPA: hypothetical protein IGZ61_002228 [Escherichia coli]|nr:hypothetical protein [Escherichia coli]